MLQFDIKIAHIGDSDNTLADFLSRQELEITLEIRLRIQEDIQTIPIEVTTFSSDVAHEEQSFLTETEKETASEEQILPRKEQSRKKREGIGDK